MVLVLPWTPRPIIDMVSESGFAMYLAHTPVAAPVRQAVIQLASIIALAKPVSESLRHMTPVM